MPSSLHDSSASVRLRDYLATALPDSHVSDASVTEAYRPLLLLHTPHTMAAFAFSNGDMAKSYDALYSSFKNYYTQQQGKWDSLDLAFVFCIDRSVHNLDRFCSAVETDVYFCRKYVVQLEEPLDASLARLPFLPLTPLHGGSFRPPSAQTFLQQCAVPAVLAKHLVVARASSPEGIVEDCITGTFGEPKELTRPTDTQVRQVVRTVTPITVDSVVIKNFRAYRQPQAFTLGADVTVLYGPNGFGKTSFFDAVDFAATGEIGRLESTGDADLKRVAKHLDSESEDSSVSLAFSTNSAPRKIVRQVSNPKVALLDGRSVDRKALLAELTSGTIPTTDRVEPFIRLFRATHLFSQEHQELAKNFQDDCTLSNEVVSRMLAFEDYANAITKAKRVLQLLETILSGADRDVTELSEQIADEKREIDRLRQAVRTELPKGVLQSQIKALRRQLKEVGVGTSDGADASAVRGWRAEIELRYADIEHRLAHLKTSAGEVEGLSAARTEATSLRKQIEQEELALHDANSKRPALELELRHAREELDQAIGSRTANKERSQLLQWIRTVKPAYAKAITDVRDVLERVGRSTTTVSELRGRQIEATELLQRNQETLSVLESDLSAARKSRSGIEALSLRIPAWQDAQTRLASRKEIALAARPALDALRKNEAELTAKLAVLSADETLLERQIADVDRNQTELRQLLSQLQGHVDSGVCPLCGEDHGSSQGVCHGTRRRRRATDR